MTNQVRGSEGPTVDINVVRALRACAHQLSEPDDLDPLLERVDDARFVLLGDCSHGTAESYAWRARLSQILIEKKGFSFIAVEGDWPECYRVHRYARGERGLAFSARELLRGVQRWPTWLWANEEVVSFIEWLRLHNERRGDNTRVGFYGLDVYGLWESLHFLDKHLGEIDPCLHEEFLRTHDGFGTFDQDIRNFAKSSLVVDAECAKQIASLLGHRRAIANDDTATTNEEDERYKEGNGALLRNSEDYYRTMLRGGATLWNNREAHMADTLARLAHDHGPQSRAIVWAHNTHIGDARYANLCEVGMTNLGQIARERFGEDTTALVGFAFHRGRVVAGSAWDTPWEDLVVPPARRGSWEAHFHAASPRNTLFLWTPEQARSVAFQSKRGHRAIGFVYHPEQEDAFNYMPTVMPRRYDALCYFEETHPLHPLHVKASHHGRLSSAV